MTSPSSPDPNVPAGVAEARVLAEIADRIAAVDDALRRLDEGRYGRCLGCGATIADDVLAADPLATTCPTCSA